MEPLIWGLIAANLAVTAWFIRRHLVLRRALFAAQKQLDEWGASGSGAAGAMAALGRPALISVEVLNALELATRESRLGKAFAGLAPELVRREVYKEFHRQLCEHLQAHGVVAEVRLHNGT
ncbi:MAG: hypothetical protein P4L83_24265 [Nevskia sp.]|nr:hypothetical protein [Nevskia sp.]